VTGARSAAPAGQTAPRGRVLPWLIALVPPAAWFAHLNVSYLLVPVSCRVGHPWWLVAVTIPAVVLAAAPMALSWRTWHRPDRAPTDRTAGLIGALLGALFLLTIAALGLSNVVVDPCR
jgi:hypothetical protein